MYNHTTKSYTLEDQSSKPYAWITENCDPADYQTMTDAEIYAWVDQLIEREKEVDAQHIEDDAQELSFPRYGYTTSHIINNADEWRAWKLQELDSDMDGERDYVLQLLKDWIANPESAR